MSNTLAARGLRTGLGTGSHASLPAAGGAGMGENQQVQVVFGLARSLYPSNALLNESPGTNVAGADLAAPEEELKMGFLW